MIVLNMLGLKAQKENTKFSSHSLGLGVGATGTGLIYRYFDQGSKLGFHTSIHGFMRDLNSDNDEPRINTKLNVGFYYLLKQTQRSRLYLYQSNDFAYSERTYNDYEYDPNYNIIYTSRKVIDRDWSNGVGLGIEFNAISNVSVNVMGGYLFHFASGDYNLSAGTSIMYNF